MVHANRLIDKLENDGLEIQMIDRSGLELTSQLDVILLVRLVENQLGQVSLGRSVLGLDLFIHLFESNDHQLQDFSLFLILRVFLGHLEVVLVFELINDFLHVFGQEERKKRGEFVLRDFQGLDEDFGKENDSLTAKKQGVQGFVLSTLGLFVAIPLLVIMGRAVQVASLLGQRAWDLESL